MKNELPSRAGAILANPTTTQQQKHSLSHPVKPTRERERGRESVADDVGGDGKGEGFIRPLCEIVAIPWASFVSVA